MCKYFFFSFVKFLYCINIILSVNNASHFTSNRIEFWFEVNLEFKLKKTTKNKMFHLRRSIRSIQRAYSHLNRAQSVTTWSPLANHFNAKPEDDRWAFLKCERTVSIKIKHWSLFFLWFKNLLATILGQQCTNWILLLNVEDSILNNMVLRLALKTGHRLFVGATWNLISNFQQYNEEVLSFYGTY